MEEPKESPDCVVATQPRFWLSPSTSHRGVPSPCTATFIPVRFWLSTVTLADVRTGTALGVICPELLSRNAAPPAAESKVSVSRFNPATVYGLVVTMWVPALKVTPEAELPQPVMESAPLPSAVFVLPLISTSIGLPSICSRFG